MIQNKKLLILLMQFLAQFILLNAGPVVSQDREDKISERENLYLTFIPHSRDYGIVLNLNKAELLLDQPDFDRNKTTVILATGLHSFDNPQYLNEILDAYLKTKKYNVVYLEFLAFSERTNSSWINTENISRIAKRFANALNKLVQKGLSPEKLNIVGHSLGAAVVAYMGSYMKEKVSLLVTLDFPNLQQDLHFAHQIAEFTIGVWTDRNGNSDPNLKFDANYFVNNGVAPQPGCPQKPSADRNSDYHLCAHLRAISIWSHMISSPKLFYGVPCNNKGVCDEKRITKLGPKSRELGDFYFVTSGRPPYGLGVTGAKKS